MLNTYGIRSINRETFNTVNHDALFFPRVVRNIAVTALRVNNAIFNVLGYIPGVSTISGCVRMTTGLAMIAVTLAIGDRNSDEGVIIGRWYDEALLTGIAQTARGALEAFVPFGWAANAALDVVATFINLPKEMVASMACEECMYGGSIDDASHVRPHDDVDYPFPLFLLHLA